MVLKLIDEYRDGVNKIQLFYNTERCLYVIDEFPNGYQTKFTLDDVKPLYNIMKKAKRRFDSGSFPICYNTDRYSYDIRRFKLTPSYKGNYIYKDNIDNIMRMFKAHFIYGKKDTTKTKLCKLFGYKQFNSRIIFNILEIASAEFLLSLHNKLKED